MMNTGMKDRIRGIDLTPGIKATLTRMIRLSKDVGYTLQEFAARFHEKYHDPDAERFVALNWNVV